MTAESSTRHRCHRVRRLISLNTVAIVLLVSCGHEQAAKPEGAETTGGPSLRTTPQTNTVLAAALLVQPKSKRFAELVAILDKTTSEPDRAAAIVFLADELHRTGDQVISTAVAKVYQDDPCRWPNAPSLFEYAREMNLRCRPFPRLDNLRQKAASLPSLNAQDREAAVRAMLDSVAFSQNGDEQQISHDTMLILADAYKQTRDKIIVDVFDAFDFGNGGYATTACSFYRAIQEAPGFAERYGPDGAPRHALRRCVGISMSEEAFGTVRVNPPPP